MTIPFSLQNLDDFILMVAGMQLQLVDHGHNLGPLQQGLEMIGQEVADTDSANPSLFIEFLKGTPGLIGMLLPILLVTSGNGPVDQI